MQLDLPSWTQGAQQAVKEGWTQAGEALSPFDAQVVQPVWRRLLALPADDLKFREDLTLERPNLSFALCEQSFCDIWKKHPLRHQGPWDNSAADLHNQALVLQWVHREEPPLPQTQATCVWAAMHGHILVLKWLRAQQPPCPWDEMACVSAAEGGHLELLH